MPPTFARLGVPDSICRALERRGIDQPFEIQAATIADGLAGRDVSGRAPTGSGKTLAFGIPLVASVGRSEPKRPRGLVLSPTRELADQIATELRTLTDDTRVGVVYGGVGYGPQLKTLRRGVEIVVACPGRLEDLIARKEVSLGDVDRVVIDEADRMSDMGFLPVVRRLLDQTSPDRQTMLFSATLDGDVAKLTRDYQREPVTHEIGEATPDLTNAKHRFWTVNQGDRIDASARVITTSWPAIVFCRTRHGSDRVARQLSQRGVVAEAIHGGHAQTRRTRTLSRFADGKVQALVATDVAARGIHVDDVAAVIHYDPAGDHKTYVHRSGRTARAGRSGLVVSLLQPDQVRETQRMKSRLGLTHPITTPDGEMTDGEVTDGDPTPRPNRNNPKNSRGRGPNGARNGRSHRGSPNGNRSAGSAGRRRPRQRRRR